jgi:hypothetical protein
MRVPANANAEPYRRRMREHLEAEHATAAVLRTLGDHDLTGRDLRLLHEAEHKRMTDHAKP